MTSTLVSSRTRWALPLRRRCQKCLQHERLRRGSRLASVPRSGRRGGGDFVRRHLDPVPAVVPQGPGDPATFLTALALNDAGSRIRKDPNPIPASFAGAFATPASSRACYHQLLARYDGLHDPLATPPRTSLRLMMSASRGPLPHLGTENGSWFPPPARTHAWATRAEPLRRGETRDVPRCPGIGLPAFPQGSMDGRDLAGAVACENTHGPTPQLGRPEAGSPVPARAARPVPADWAAEPQDASAQAYTRPCPCKSRTGEDVNRPSVSFSHLGGGMTPGPFIGRAPQARGSSVGCLDRSKPGNGSRRGLHGMLVRVFCRDELPSFAGHHEHDTTNLPALHAPGPGGSHRSGRTRTAPERWVPTCTRRWRSIPTGYCSEWCAPPSPALRCPGAQDARDQEVVPVDPGAQRLCRGGRRAAPDPPGVRHGSRVRRPRSLCRATQKRPGSRAAGVCRARPGRRWGGGGERRPGGPRARGGSPFRLVRPAWLCGSAAAPSVSVSSGPARAAIVFGRVLGISASDGGGCTGPSLRVLPPRNRSATLTSEPSHDGGAPEPEQAVGGVWSTTRGPRRGMSRGSFPSGPGRRGPVGPSGHARCRRACASRVSASRSCRFRAACRSASASRRGHPRSVRSSRFRKLPHARRRPSPLPGRSQPPGPPGRQPFPGRKLSRRDAS